MKKYKSEIVFYLCFLFITKQKHRITITNYKLQTQHPNKMNALIEYLPGQIEVLKEAFANNYGSLKLANRAFDAVSAVDYINYKYTINVYYNLIELAKEYPSLKKILKFLKNIHLKCT